MQGCPLVGRFVLSTGTNWYTCYRCSYDLCVSCVHRRLDRVSRDGDTGAWCTTYILLK